MKFAIFLPADQTILYLTEDGYQTTEPCDAGLWNSYYECNIFIKWLLKKYYGEDYEEASKVVCSLIKSQEYMYVEQVENEEEFRNRESTW